MNESLIFYILLFKYLKLWKTNWLMRIKKNIIFRNSITDWVVKYMCQFFTHNSSCLLGYSDTKRQGKKEGKDTFCFGNVGYVLHLSSVEYILFLLYCQIRHLYFEKKKWVSKRPKMSQGKIGSKHPQELVTITDQDIISRILILRYLHHQV